MIIKTFKYKADPMVGDRRTIKKFAWRPMFVYDSTYADKHLVWLEHLELNQAYRESYMRVGDIEYLDNDWITMSVKIVNG